jgi:hypothetical protein
MVGVLLWFSLGDTLVGGLLKIPRYLPSGTVRGIVLTGSSSAHFDAVASAALLTAYVALALLIAARAIRRDTA